MEQVADLGRSGDRLRLSEGGAEGTYTVQAVHERFGEQEMEITVGASDSQQVDFSFTD